MVASAVRSEIGRESLWEKERAWDCERKNEQSLREPTSASTMLPTAGEFEKNLWQGALSQASEIFAQNTMTRKRKRGQGIITIYIEIDMILNNKW